MRTQPPIEAEESQVGMPCSRSAVLRQRLCAAVSDDQARADLYASLMIGSVYVEGQQILLTDDGPVVEFDTVSTMHGPAVVAYSSRSRRRELDPNIDSIAFAYLVHALPEGVGIVLDPNDECLLVEGQDVHALRGASPIHAH